MLGRNRWLTAREAPEYMPGVVNSEGEPILHAVECEMSGGIGGYLNFDNAGSISYHDTPAGHNVVDIVQNVGKAKFAVTYRALPYKVRDGDTLGDLNFYMVKTKTDACENLALAQASYYWEGGNPLKDVWPEKIPKPFPTTQYTYLWKLVHESQGPSDAVTSTLIGGVNDAIFDNFFPPETLLCLPPQTRFYRDGYGDRVRDIAYIFVHRSTSWNKFFRGNVTPPTFTKLLSVKGNAPVFPLVNFNLLFQ